MSPRSYLLERLPESNYELWVQYILTWACAMREHGRDICVRYDHTLPVSWVEYRPERMRAVKG